MQIDVFTLFPEWFEWFSDQRHMKNLAAAGTTLDVVDMRATTPIANNRVDDTPYGGGAGMVIRVDVVEAALRARYGADPAELRQRRRVVVLSPVGRRLDDGLAEELAREPELTLLCGRYEGFDQRVHDHFASDVISVGDYVLSGGELAAMVVIDAVTRKLPEAHGDERSALEESFSKELDGAPEYPHYTRPAEHRGWPVPEVLFSGNHAEIERWRREQSELRRVTRDLPS
ncbi:MAG: tRNA (guanosine(37)-N1)-methyltransferase TrmD [Actinobacteria bacterium]|nr:tRNA (guanosine(37)-N1)-methyltransferase TrmD [Actinomycetota bacterium]